MIKAILAVGENGEIGQDGDMPWKRRLPKDLEYFKKMTLGCEVFMGNTTFKTLPFKDGFPERRNSILTTKVPAQCSTGYKEKSGNCVYMNKTYMKNVLLTLNEDLRHHTGWIVGGSRIYVQFWDYVEEVHLTRVKDSFPDADTFFPVDISLGLNDFEKVGRSIDVSGDDLEAYVEVWRRVE